ncbi:MAG: glycogen/starch/alpha-glucan family phosphorylase, partial [Thermodesulfobacteriota bacterium]
MKQPVKQAEFSEIIVSIIYHIKYTIGKSVSEVSKHDISRALSLTLKDLIQDKLKSTEELYRKKDYKKVYYLSIEYLVGTSLENNMLNLGIYDICEEEVSKLGHRLDEILETDVEPSLGTGGLGRLGACFLDSFASLGMPGYGYGINYEFGSLKQEIKNGYQTEEPDDWERDRYPFLIERLDEKIEIPVFGHIEKMKDINEGYRYKWENQTFITGVPYDLPIVGYGGKTVNYLRLFSARSSIKLNFEKFYYGNFAQASKDKTYCENVSKIIYPSDSNSKGKELRLIQEYFLVACSLKDIVNQYKKDHNKFDHFASKVAIQINDTHPALAIAELMRILTDDIKLSWEKSWGITTKTFAYTNHTLLPEALEKWPVSLLEKVLPLHMEIIYKINSSFLKKVEEKWPGDWDRLRRMSLIEEHETKKLRMTNLSIVGSHSVNGVAAVHSELVKSLLVPDFYELWPEKFNNKTNGITQRRWLLKSNPDLAKLITKKIGDGWILNLYKLKELENYCDEEEFQSNFL